MENVSQTLNSMQVVCFKIGQEEYGIEILQVQEILKLPKVTKLPRSAGYIMGVMDLRGRVIPIVNLGKRFGSDIEDSGSEKRAIVVDIRGRPIGLAIDTVSHVVKLDSEDIEPPPPIVKGISGRYIVGVAKHDDGFVIILDIDQIFSSEELNILSDRMPSSPLHQRVGLSVESLKVGQKLSIRFFQSLDKDLGISSDRHEVGVANPAGDDMPVDVFFYACTGGPSEVEA